MNYKYKYHALRRDWFNFSLLAHRDFDAMLISMHQSGTHWLQYMLTLALVKKLGIEQPEYVQNELFFGNASSYNCEHDVPKIAGSHSIPHMLVGSKSLNKVLRFPRYLILVRDMRASLVSNYEKWKDHIEYTDFSTFIRGDERGKRFNSDIWWCIRFYNAWGRVIKNIPETTMFIKYEDLTKNTFDTLKSISAFLELDLNDDQIQFGINEASKDKMQKKMRPNNLTVIRKDDRSPADWFSKDDEHFFISTCNNYLKHDFGYMLKETG